MALTWGHPCSRLSMCSIANFGLEHKYYLGQQVAAYAITTQGKGCGVVRVVDRVTDHTILNGKRGAVVDLSFSLRCTMVVGAMDSLGTVFVHKVMEGSSGLASERVVEVLREVALREMMHRLIWWIWFCRQHRPSVSRCRWGAR